MERLIDQTQRMLADMLGSPLRESRSWDDVVAALEAGGKDVIVEVLWEQDGYDPAPHELVLKELADYRVVYYNPTSPTDQAVGTRLPGNLTVPERVVEGPGLESMPANSLRDLFVKGQGKALLPT